MSPSACAIWCVVYLLVLLARMPRSQMPRTRSFSSRSSWSRSSVAFWVSLALLVRLLLTLTTVGLIMVCLPLSHTDRLRGGVQVGRRARAPIFVVMYLYSHVCELHLGDRAKEVGDAHFVRWAPKEIRPDVLVRVDGGRVNAVELRQTCCIPDLVRSCCWSGPRLP